MGISSIAQEVLSRMGASVQPIPTSDKEESDWLATLGNFRLLIEEKTKLENPQAAAERGEALKSGEVHGTTAPLRPNNRLSGIIRKAASQVSSTAKDVPHDARVVWISATGFDREARDHQAYSTLYGVTNIFDMDSTESLRECFFFYNSDFFRFRQALDGAILAVFDGRSVSLRLCLNPFSPRFEVLRDSPFAPHFGDAVIDPPALDASGSAMVVDTDVDRSDAQAVLDFLRIKYGMPRLQQMDLHMATAVIAVPRQER